MENNKIALFQEKNIRREWIDEQWFFSVIDVIEILAETAKPSDYWYQLKKREKSYGIDLSTFCRKVKMLGLDGKKYPTDAANTEGLLRIIIAIPCVMLNRLNFGSPKSAKNDLKKSKIPNSPPNAALIITAQKAIPKSGLNAATKASKPENA